VREMVGVTLPNVRVEEPGGDVGDVFGVTSILDERVSVIDGFEDSPVTLTLGEEIEGLEGLEDVSVAANKVAGSKLQKVDHGFLELNDE